MPKQDNGLQKKWKRKVKTEVSKTNEIELEEDHEDAEVREEHKAVGSEGSSCRVAVFVLAVGVH